MKCQLDRATVYYEAKGEGRPLLCLHGWPLDHRHMVSTLEPLFRKRTGWRRLYPDLPGMGRTQGPEWLTCQDEVLEVLVQFVDQVIPGERFCVAGLSYGGLLAQGLVHRLGERLDGVLFVVPSMGPKEARRLAPWRLIHEEPLDTTGVSPEDLAGFREMAVAQTQRLLDAWKNTILPPQELADDPFLERLRKHYGFSFDHRALPRAFEKPTLFLVGRQDNVCGYVDAWDVIESYPRATFAVLDRAGHCLDMEQPELTKALINEWLDRVEEAAEALPYPPIGGGVNRT